MNDLLGRCVSIDLEVDPERATIFAFTSVTHDPAIADLAIPIKPGSLMHYHSNWNT